MKKTISKKNIIWIMGPTSSGKTTIAKKIVHQFRNKGKFTIHYDGDEVRDFYGKSHGFSFQDRLRVIKTLAHLAIKAAEAGALVIVSALTANEDAREYIKKNIHDLKIVYLECSIDTCVNRDPKGLYSKAIDRKINTLIGINSTYYPINNPDIIINTEVNDIERCVAKTINYIEK